MLSIPFFQQQQTKYRVQIKLKQYFIIITIYDPLGTQTIERYYRIKKYETIFTEYALETLIIKTNLWKKCKLTLRTPVKKPKQTKNNYIALLIDFILYVIYNRLYNRYEQLIANSV